MAMFLSGFALLIIVSHHINPSNNAIVIILQLLCVLSFCLLCCCNGIVTAAGLCTGPIPVHFCGLQPEGGYVYAIIR